MEVAINLTAIILAVISVLVSLAALSMVIGMKLSTHKIEFKPLEISDPFKQEEDFTPFTEPSEDLVQEALRLSKEGKEKKKKLEKDPLDEILESNNF
jgi:flagellar basal body-associated protein FliL